MMIALTAYVALPDNATERVLRHRPELMDDRLAMGFICTHNRDSVSALFALARDKTQSAMNLLDSPDFMVEVVVKFPDHLDYMREDTKDHIVDKLLEAEEKLWEFLRRNRAIEDYYCSWAHAIYTRLEYGEDAEMARQIPLLHDAEKVKMLVQRSGLPGLIQFAADDVKSEPSVVIAALEECDLFDATSDYPFSNSWIGLADLRSAPRILADLVFDHPNLGTNTDVLCAGMERDIRCVAMAHDDLDLDNRVIDIMARYVSVYSPNDMIRLMLRIKMCGVHLSSIQKRFRQLVSLWATIVGEDDNEDQAQARSEFIRLELPLAGHR